MTNSYSTEHWQSVWTSIFQRKGKAGPHTNRFELLDSNDRAQIEAKLPTLSDDEIPVLASVPSEFAWSLLTTNRLITWRKDNGVFAMSLGNLSKASIDLAKMTGMGLTKERFNAIHIVSVTGADHDLQVEPGAPCNGFLSVLMQIARRNRSALMP